MNLEKLLAILAALMGEAPQIAASVTNIKNAIKPPKAEPVKVQVVDGAETGAESDSQPKLGG